MSSLHLSEDIPEAYQNVRSDKNPTNWMFLHYSDNNKLALGATGNGGISELVGHFKPDERAYGYIRVISGDDMSARAKFVFVAWVGEKVSPLKKARVSTDKAFVKEVIKDFAVEIFATDLNDLKEDEVMHKVVKAGGANYGDGH
eukprot:TRINITY_DN1195_c0_g1_i1.p1 TRINITY_DN1195_c0_g1~~TRINITY_DN1195_c0_g1_i1.p1  ORF type:complete len:144 (-),score=41.62 TRINITY_DN1195_c0_g1_i1:71-502(-)